MRTRSLIAAIVLAGCNIELALPDPAGCEERQAYYLDTDGDGLGDGTDVYVGCEPPGPEWVTELAPHDTGDTAAR